MSGKAKVIRVHNDLPLRMHATPFLGARVVSKLPVGAIVDIEAVEGSWMCVYDPASGHTGWVDRKYVQELPPPLPDFPAPCSIEPVGRGWIGLAWQWLWVLICFLVFGWLFSAALSFIGII